MRKNLNPTARRAAIFAVIVSGGVPQSNFFRRKITLRYAAMAAFQTLLGLGTKHKSTTYKEMRNSRTVPTRQAQADPNLLWLAETTG
jgi:hypothetical protein